MWRDVHCVQHALCVECIAWCTLCAAHLAYCEDPICVTHASGKSLIWQRNTNVSLLSASSSHKNTQSIVLPKYYQCTAWYDTGNWWWRLYSTGDFQKWWNGNFGHLITLVSILCYASAVNWSNGWYLYITALVQLWLMRMMSQQQLSLTGMDGSLKWQLMTKNAKMLRNGVTLVLEQLKIWRRKKVGRCTGMY